MVIVCFGKFNCYVWFLQNPGLTEMLETSVAL
ncbi:MAG: hypothetical protein ACI9LU_000862 [Polaribacter sp.]|jgi:hypothetical protein